MSGELTVYKRGEFFVAPTKNPTIESARAGSGYTCPACKAWGSCDQMDGWMGNLLLYKLQCNKCGENWTVTKKVPIDRFNGSDVFEQNKFAQEAYVSIGRRVFNEKLFLTEKTK